MKQLFSILSIVMVLLGSLGSLPLVSAVGCTEELKECPDGTNVARNPARNCEFDPCSGEVPACLADARVCPDGTSVARDPYNNCKFPACPGERSNCGQSCKQTYEQCKADAQGIEMAPGENRDRAIQSIIQECERSHSVCLNECPTTSMPPAQKSCEAGCYALTSEACVPIGTRLVEKGTPSFCGPDGAIEAQKADGAGAQNSYECLGNFASDGKCISVSENLNILQRIFKWFSRIFGGN